MVQEPTRGRAGQRSNILDLILTNEENSVDNVVYEAPLGKGDHSVIKFRIKIECEVEVPTTIKYLYDKVNFEDIRIFLKEKDWEAEMYELSNIEEKMAIFCSNLYRPRGTICSKKGSKKTQIMMQALIIKINIDQRWIFTFYELSNENTDCGEDS